MKIVSQLDYDGYFVSFATPDESPLEPGVFLLPGGCVDTVPPTNAETGTRWRWLYGEWTMEVCPTDIVGEWAYNLVPATPPSLLLIGGVRYPFNAISDTRRESLGWLPLLSDIPDSLTGYAAPVVETVDGRQVAMQHALGTASERAVAIARKKWKAQAAVRNHAEALRIADDPQQYIDERIRALKTLIGEKNGTYKTIP